MAAPLALIGLPGAGKTAVAPLLAARLGRRWDDLDRVVADAAGRSIPELLAGEGEALFREREAKALRTILAAHAADVTGLVLACGGGVVVGSESRALLAGGATVIWLRVTPEAAWARLGREGAATRPLLSMGSRGQGESPRGPAEGDDAALERLRSLERAREPLYESIAALRVATDNRTPEDVAAELEAVLRARWAGSGS
jgi:shikimate kinase